MKTAIHDLIDDLQRYFANMPNRSSQDVFVCDDLINIAKGKLEKEKYIINQAYNKGERDGIMHDDIKGYTYDSLEGYYLATFNDTNKYYDHNRNFKMTERTCLSIYENILNALNDEKLKLVDIATETGISRQRLADIRTNKRKMTFAEAEKLIKALNL